MLGLQKFLFLYVQVLQLWKCNLKRTACSFSVIDTRIWKNENLLCCPPFLLCQRDIAGPWMWNTCASAEKHPTLAISAKQKLALEHVASVSIHQSVSRFCWHLLTWARYNSKHKNWYKYLGREHVVTWASLAEPLIYTWKLHFTAGTPRGVPALHNISTFQSQTSTRNNEEHRHVVIV